MGCTVVGVRHWASPKCGLSSTSELSESEGWVGGDGGRGRRDRAVGASGGGSSRNNALVCLRVRAGRSIVATAASLQNWQKSEVILLKEGKLSERKID